ncbi:hypothetical protein [Micromonospora sp. CPCC 205558]|uniref:hypothetical protein n=1 Tax=Micromonospora sp. CPCC 205558 TaxID=3122403 RepID=UPI002FF0F58C
MPDPAMRLLLSAARACQQQADTLQQTLTRVHDATPAPDAWCNRDDRALNTMVRAQARRQIWRDCVLTAMSMGVHVADHVRALGLLLTHVREQGAPVYAHAALTRGAVESASWLWWLLAEGEPFATRLGRGVAFLVEDATLAIRAAQQVPSAAYMAAPVDGIKRRRQALLDRLEDARIETIADRPGTRLKGVRVVRDGEETSTGTKVSTLVTEAFADLPALYDLLSGTAHARAWGLSDSMSMHGDEAAWSANVIDVSASALTGLLAAQRAGAMFATYRGFPDDPGVAHMRDQHTNFDQEMVRYGRAAGLLAGMGPVTGFLD